MSQRVQKGNTLFRPVARPRGRAGTESRQASVYPDSNQLQDVTLQRSASVIPHIGVLHRPPVETPGPTPAEDREPQPSGSQLPPQMTFLPTLIVPQPPVIRAAHSRMPPMIGSSHPSTSRISVPVSASAVSQPTVSTSQVMTNSLLPLQSTTTPSEPHIFNDFVPQHIPELHDPFSVLPFAINALQQIDPQLMSSHGIPGPHPFGSQEPSFHDPPFTDGPPVALDGVSTVKSARPRRSTRKRTIGDTTIVEQDDLAESSTSGKRRRSRKSLTGGNANTAEIGHPAKRRRSSGQSRTRPPSLPPFDPDADPGEELDPTVITMATLCDDTGRGRVSSRAVQIVNNHAAWRAANREKRARMKSVLEAKKYGRNLDDEEESANRNAANASTVDATASPILEPAPGSLPVAGADVAVAENEDIGSKDADGFDYGGMDLTVSQYNPQVRIGANGETIIDEDSLFVNRNEEHHTEGYTHVEESDFTKFVNSGTYSKKARGSRWTAEETELFYDALSQFGENYELISYVMPGRDRKACKNKFKMEDKRDSARVTYCLNNRRPYDIATLSRLTGKDFSGPTPEIRAPTPHRSTELETSTETQMPASPPSTVKRKKSRTPSVREMDVEVVGHIDDFEQEDISKSDHI